MLHAKRSEPVVILVPLLTQSSKPRVQCMHEFWLLYANLLQVCGHSERHLLQKATHMQKDNHLGLPGLIPPRARTARQPTQGKRTSSAHGTSV